MMLTSTTYKALFSLHLVLTITFEVDPIIMPILRLGAGGEGDDRG